MAGGDDGELLLDAGKETFSEGNTVAYQDKCFIFLKITLNYSSTKSSNASNAFLLIQPHWPMV